MTNYYVVIDTNVLVTAMLKWNSAPGGIVQLAFDGPIILILNMDIFNEYRSVLLRPKFHLTDEIVNSVLGSLKSKGIFVEADFQDIKLIDPNDNVFYEVVMEKRKTEEAYLVTGNIKHFPIKPFIVTPRQMLDIILGERR